jgi:hypothetical protein
MGQTIRTIPDGDLTLPKGRDRLAAITAFTMSLTFITLSPRSQTSPFLAFTTFISVTTLNFTTSPP